jgi:non-specific serine/threonine protein kinase/serine/threonine-protein kinase
MDPDYWQKINELFHLAIERDMDERSRFLSAACEGDQALQAEIERLLAAHQRAATMIGSSVFTDRRALAVAFEDASAAGRQLGPYRVIRELGRGGMGAVYLAERADDQYEKRVAIKLVKRGMDTDAVIRQFRHERQILATIDHPNVARFIDGGATDEHLPYFVMEYVEGRPIDQYCHQHALSVTARLRLFRQVCDAVSYAHQHLVVHRDLKPSNILVTVEGMPKLLDFGIAKIVQPGAGAETTSTVAALRLMTPDYASPEQLQGRAATTLSDVYSLGVVLYELLARRSPYIFDSRGFENVARVIAAAEPARPSDAVCASHPRAIDCVDDAEMSATEAERLRRQLRGDLDNIVLKAMHRDPEHRYQSVEQLSSDIGRHLDGLPVTARKDTVRYRAMKFMRRNRLAVAGGALLLLTLVAGIVSSSWLAHEARAQERIAKREQGRAERRFNEVRQLARSVLFDYHDAIKDLPGATPVRARLVRDALTYLDSLAGEAQGDRSLQQELAAAYVRVGDVQGGTMYANLGDTAGAISSYRKAMQLDQASLVANPANADAQRDLAFAEEKLGLLLWETGEIAHALERLRHTLSLFEALSARVPSNAEFRQAIARSHDRLGMIGQETGDTAGALRHYNRSREIMETLMAADPTNPAVQRSLSTIHEHIGTLLLIDGDLERALAHNREALELRTALVAHFPLNADYRRVQLVSYYNDGEILAKMGHTREALKSYRRSLVLAEKLSSEDPTNEQYRGDLAYALIRVGDMLAALHQDGDALVQYRRSQRVRAHDVASDPGNLWKRSSLIEAHAKITGTLARSGQSAAALAASAETVSLMQGTTIEPTNANFRSFFADTYTDLANAQMSMARQARASGVGAEERWRAARRFYQQSVEIWQDLHSRAIVSAIDRPKLEAARHALAECDRVLTTVTAAAR